MKMTLKLLALVVLCVGVHVHAQRMDPDARRNVQQIVISKGYPSERHQIVTADNYNLTAYRIPHGVNENSTSSSSSPRPAVILMHGLLDSSFTWIFNEANESLPYLLADRGYDVWMVNNRGNVQSQLPMVGPGALTPDDDGWWQFTWNEMAKYDTPAFVDYVLGVTKNAKLAWVGHSEGTMQMFAALVSEGGAALASKLSSFTAFGPVAFVNHAKLAPELAPVLDATPEQWYASVGRKQFAGFPKKFAFVDEEFCNREPQACIEVIRIVTGPFPPEQINATRASVFAGHEPAGTSSTNMYSFVQLAALPSNESVFQAMDYGYFGNECKYGTPGAPPVYDLSKYPSSLPTYLWSGALDILADPVDVAKLIAVLPPTVKHTQIADYAHLSFCWDWSARNVFYEQVIQFIGSNL
jgi:pimeloyl-ACP methyl ester carboxylesterase